MQKLIEGHEDATDNSLKHAGDAIAGLLRITAETAANVAANTGNRPAEAAVYRNRLLQRWVLRKHGEGNADAARGVASDSKAGRRADA
jgi:hypothetical protein